MYKLQRIILSDAGFIKRTALALEQQEKQLFQQVFVHCKTVGQLQEQLLKRLAPYQDKAGIHTSMLSLLDVMDAIDEVLQPDLNSHYSEVEPYLHEIKENYYQRVRKAEVSFSKY